VCAREGRGGVRGKGRPLPRAKCWNPAELEKTVRATKPYLSNEGRLAEANRTCNRPGFENKKAQGARF